MKVVIFLRGDAASLVGGTTEQARRYADYLRANGAEVLLWTSDGEPPDTYDIGHLFNLDWPVETGRQLELARRRCDRVVLSTVHHRNSWMEELHRGARRGTARLLARSLSLPHFEAARGAWLARRHPRLWPEAGSQLLRGPRRRQRSFLEAVDTWLVLAEGERRSLEEDFGVQGRSMYVPNGALLGDGDLPPGLPKEFVLCVGRVEARKNQTMLLDVAERIGLAVVLVGAVNPRHREVVRAVEERTERNGVIWLRNLDRESVLALHREAMCHVLPSWCEVVPLVDLEASLAGTPVVTTSRGYTNEYLADSARYWDPASGPAGLQDRIAEALGNGNGPARPESDLSWDRAGRLLLDAYRRTLETPRAQG